MFPSSAPPSGERLERILSSLAREWLRITNGLLIAEDPEPALRSLNKLICVNGGEGHKVVRALSGSKRRHAKCAKLNPLTKQRFKPQVSAAFGSVSIRIDAQPVDT
jgi:hypothetical protein